MDGQFIGIKEEYEEVARSILLKAKPLEKEKLRVTNIDGTKEEQGPFHMLQEYLNKKRDILKHQY